MPGSGSVFQIQIRIEQGPEYGSNTDPDPKHWFAGSWLQCGCTSACQRKGGALKDNRGVMCVIDLMNVV